MGEQWIGGEAWGREPQAEAFGPAAKLSVSLVQELGGSLLQGLSPHLLDVNGMHAFSFNTERDFNNFNLLPSEHTLSSGGRAMSHGARWMHNRAQASSPSEDVSTRIQRTCFILPGAEPGQKPLTTDAESLVKRLLSALERPTAIISRYSMQPVQSFVASKGLTLYSRVLNLCTSVVRRYPSYCCKRACWHTKA